MNTTRRAFFSGIIGALVVLIPTSVWAFFGKFGRGGSKSKKGGP